MYLYIYIYVCVCVCLYVCVCGGVHHLFLGGGVAGGGASGRGYYRFACKNDHSKIRALGGQQNAHVANSLATPQNRSLGVLEERGWETIGVPFVSASTALSVYSAPSFRGATDSANSNLIAPQR